MTDVSMMNNFDENANVDVTKNVKRKIFTESHVRRTTSRMDSDGNELRNVEEFSTSNGGESAEGLSGVDERKRALRRQEQTRLSSSTLGDLYSTPEKRPLDRQDTPRPREDWFKEREAARSRSVDPEGVPERGQYAEYSRRKSREDNPRSTTPSSYLYRSSLTDRSTQLTDDAARKRAIEQLLESTRKFARAPKSNQKTSLDSLVSDIMNKDLVSSSGEKYSSERYGRSDRYSGGTSDRYESQYSRTGRIERSATPKSVEREYGGGTSDRYESQYSRTGRIERSATPKSVEREYIVSSPSEKYTRRNSKGDRFAYPERAATVSSVDKDYKSRYMENKYDSTSGASSRYQYKYSRGSSGSDSQVSREDSLNQYRSPTDDAVSTTDVDTKVRRSIFTRSYLSRDGEVLKDEETRQDEVFSDRPEMTTRVQRYPPVSSAPPPLSPLSERQYGASDRPGYEKWRGSSRVDEVLRRGDSDVAARIRRSDVDEPPPISPLSERQDRANDRPGYEKWRGSSRVDEVLRRGDSDVAARIRRSDVDTSVNITREVQVSRAISEEETARQERKAKGMEALRKKIAALSKSVDDLGQYKNRSMLRSYVSEHEAKPPVEVPKKDFPKVEKYEIKSKRVEPKGIDVDEIDYHKPDYTIPAGVRSPDRVMSPPPRSRSPSTSTSPSISPRVVSSPEASPTGYHKVGELGIHIPKQISLKNKKKNRDWWDVMTCEDADKSLKRGDRGWWDARTAEGVDNLLGIRPVDKYMGAVMAVYDTSNKPRSYNFVRTDSISSLNEEPDLERPRRRMEAQSPHHFTRAASHMYLDEGQDGKVELLIRVKTEDPGRPRYVAVRRGPNERAVIVRTKSVSELPPYASQVVHDVSNSEGVRLKDGFIKLQYKDMTPEFRKAWARIIGVEQKEILAENGTVEIPVNVRHTTTEPVYALPNKSQKKKTRMSASIVEEPHVVHGNPGRPDEIELVADITPQAKAAPQSTPPPAAAPIREPPRAPSLTRSEGSAFQQVRPMTQVEIMKETEAKLQKTDSKRSKASGASSASSKGSKKFWKRSPKKHGRDETDSADMEVHDVMYKSREDGTKDKKGSKKTSSKKKKSEKKAQQKHQHDAPEVLQLVHEDHYGVRKTKTSNDDKFVPNLYGAPLVKPKIEGVGNPVTGSFSGKASQSTRATILEQYGDQNHNTKAKALPRATSRTSGGGRKGYSDSSDDVFFTQPRSQVTKYVTAERYKSERQVSK